MAGTSSGYDLSVSTFSPDGRVYQVEYAAKAVDASPLCVGILCEDGILFGVQKELNSPMLLASTNTRIFAISDSIGMVVAGLLPDGRQLWHVARKEVESYEQLFGVNITAAVLAERLALYMHAYTLQWHTRPFGNSIIVGALETTSSGEQVFTGELYAVDSSGCCSKTKGSAFGRGRPSAKTELEKMEFYKKTCENSIKDIIKMFMLIDEESGSSTSKRRIYDIAIIKKNISSGNPEINFVDEEQVKTASQIAQQELQDMDS